MSFAEQVHSAAAHSWILPRLAEGPRALRRTGRRVTQSSMLLFELMRHCRRLYPEGPGLRDSEGRVGRLSWVAENLCALHGVRVQVEGTPPSGGPYVLVANHVSYMDPLAICSVVSCSAVAKQEVGDWPLIGESLRTLGVMMVSREDPHSGARVLRQALRTLEAGTGVLVFPEGTTSAGDDVLPLRRGIFGAARIAGVPVVPVAIRYDVPEMAWIGAQLFVPHYVRTTARRAALAELRFGAPVDPGAYATPQALAHHVRGELRRLLGSSLT